MRAVELLVLEVELELELVVEMEPWWIEGRPSRRREILAGLGRGRALSWLAGCKNCWGSEQSQKSKLSILRF